MIYNYVEFDAATQQVVMLHRIVGVTAPPTPQDGNDTAVMDGDASLAQPTATAQPYWRGGGIVWVEEADMVSLIASAVERCYGDIDAVYARAIGNRQAEYTDAEIDARACLAGAPATENVAGFARSNPTGVEQTDLWAAEQIIARADAFRTAQVVMRTQRFDSQAAMRASLTPADLAQVVYLWDQFIAGLRMQLGLT